jgi:hypothetical protein
MFISGSPICSALFLKLTFKDDLFVLFHYNKHFGNASYFTLEISTRGHEYEKGYLP